MFTWSQYIIAFMFYKSLFKLIVLDFYQTLIEYSNILYYFDVVAVEKTM